MACIVLENGRALIAKRAWRDLAIKPRAATTEILDNGPGSRRTRQTIETIYQKKWVVSRHKEAPLLQEREQFLVHCQQQGTSYKALQNMAAELLAVIRLLRMEELREVGLGEIKQAAKRWVEVQRSNPRARSYANSADYFIFVAKKWLRFQGKLRIPSPPRARFADELDDFVSFMATEQGLSPMSIRSHRWKTAKFLEWFTNRHRLLSSATLDDVDEFLAFKADNGWNRESVSTAAQALRSFFRYVERRDWCKPGIAAGIQGPKIYRCAGLPEGPTWEDVQRILQSSKGESPAALRARAILFLIAVYGLRSGEVQRLLLEDIDWRAETFVITHSKRGGSQLYPLRPDVGDAILKYLTNVRPRTSCRNVFVTISPPYRPLNRSTMYCIVSTHLTRLGIQCPKKGPHSLRHACATHLLQQGASFKEIGDILGHRHTNSVGAYAKVDLNALRTVANVSLGGLL
jgi:integrase/recombinase XerD